MYFETILFGFGKVKLPNENVVDVESRLTTGTSCAKEIAYTKSISADNTSVLADLENVKLVVFKFFINFLGLLL